MSKGHRYLKNRFINNIFTNILKKVSEISKLKICSHWQNIPEGKKNGGKDFRSGNNNVETIFTYYVLVLVVLNDSTHPTLPASAQGKIK